MGEKPNKAVILCLFIWKQILLNSDLTERDIYAGGEYILEYQRDDTFVMRKSVWSSCLNIELNKVASYFSARTLISLPLRDRQKFNRPAFSTMQSTMIGEDSPFGFVRQIIKAQMLCQQISSLTKKKKDFSVFELPLFPHSRPAAYLLAWWQSEIQQVKLSQEQ